MTTETDILGRLRALREARELRQEDVAKRIGVDRTTYVRKEAGDNPITTAEWLKLAEALGVKAEEFFKPT